MSDNFQNSIETLTACVSLLETQPTGYLNLVISKVNLVRNMLRRHFGEDRGNNEVIIKLDEILELLVEPLGRNESPHGRPLQVMSREGLEYLLGISLSVTKIASMFGVCRKTVHRRLKSLGLSVSQTYTPLSDAQLDAAVEAVILEHPNTGWKRMVGFLRQRQVKVPIYKIQQSMRRVDPAGVEQRRSVNRAIYRRSYFVQHSMEVWHIDTHHKLIRWGFVIRGGIDGKSRTIVYLDAGCDNTSASNFENFMDGVRSYGIPLRTRSDKGGENLDIACYMLHSRGTGRGSHICGRSVHNQRIERLWRDVHYGCLSAYKRMFIRLEEQGLLDIDNAKTIAILQLVFLPRIQKHLKDFMHAWNLHPLSSEHNQTPLQLMLTNLPPQYCDLFVLPAPADPRHLQQEGLSFNSPMNMESYEGILSEEELSTIRQVDVLAQSNMLGADIYMNLIDILYGLPQL